MVEMLEQGNTLRSVAEQFHISYELVGRIAGREASTAGKAARKEALRAAVEGLWQQGYMISEINKQLGTGSASRHFPGYTNEWERAYLLRFVDKSSGCWVWTRGKSRAGYGRHKGGYTHVQMWKLVNGPVPAGMEVCHTCDNPPCINPEHLFIGTHPAGKAARKEALRAAVDVLQKQGLMIGEINKQLGIGNAGRYFPGHTNEWEKAYLLRFVDKNSGCWVWTRGKSRAGYGRCKGSYTHVRMWELVNGPVPAGMEVCHTCDNPSCINPEHLFLGTHQQNMQDMFTKGRDTNHLGLKHGTGYQAHRNAALRRDEYKCVVCGGTKSLQVDHIVAVADGGSDEVDNLQTLCRKCHDSKHHTLPY